MPSRSLPHELGDAFAVGGARRAGVTERRLRAEDLLRPFHGVRATTPPATAAPVSRWEREASELRRRIEAYRTIMPAQAVFAAQTAAFLLGLPLPPGRHAELHVAVPFPGTAPKRPGVRGIQVLPRMMKRIEVDGMPLTDAATTWAMLGRTLDVYDLVAVGDAIVRVPRRPGGFGPLGVPLATRDALFGALTAGRRLGADRLREALSRVRDGASSRPESWLRLVLVDGGLPEPVLDYDVYRDDGRLLGCSELAYPALRVAVEYESDGHLDRPQLERDIDKYTDYSAAGWTTVRLTGTHVFHVPSEAVRRVRAALRRASSP